MESEHTAEPWEDTDFYADMSQMVVGEHILSIPNYNRARVCVNAMQGVSDPAGYIAARDAEVAGLKAERDEIHRKYFDLQCELASAFGWNLNGQPFVAEVRKCVAERDSMREALEFYADEGNYKAPRWGEDTQLSDYPVMGDRGDIARAARAKKGEASNGQ